MNSQTSSADFSLYHAAVAADRELTEALVAVYGAKFASDARYLPRHKHFASIVLNALDAKHEADAAWLASMRQSSSDTGAPR
jgi:hypothetical protein